LEEGIRYIAGFLGKFIEVNEGIANKIRKFLMSEVDETWKVRNRVTVMWWKVKK